MIDNIEEIIIAIQINQRLNLKEFHINMNY